MQDQFIKNQAGYPLGSSYLLFLDSGSRSLRSLARNDGPKNIRQLHFILNLSEMDNQENQSAMNSKYSF